MNFKISKLNSINSLSMEEAHKKESVVVRWYNPAQKHRVVKILISGKSLKNVCSMQNKLGAKKVVLHYDRCSGIHFDGCWQKSFWWWMGFNFLWIRSIFFCRISKLVHVKKFFPCGIFIPVFMLKWKKTYSNYSSLFGGWIKGLQDVTPRFRYVWRAQKTAWRWAVWEFG